MNFCLLLHFKLNYFLGFFIFILSPYFSFVSHLLFVAIMVVTCKMQHGVSHILGYCRDVNFGSAIAEILRKKFIRERRET